MEKVAIAEGGVWGLSMWHRQNGPDNRGCNSETKLATEE